MNATTHIKAAVAAAFSAAAETYDRSAQVQREIAARLAKRITALPLPEHPRILDLGCGTGFLCRELLQSVSRADWFLADISAAMIERCRRNFGGHASFLVMDGEDPCLMPEPGFDLICSSLAFQWFGDLGPALRRLTALLKPGGHLMYSTLAADSFCEWRRAHEALGLSAVTPDYPSVADLRTLVPAGIRGAIDEERLVHSYSSGRAFLDHWRQIGAHLAAPGSKPLSPGNLRRVLRQFEGPAGIRVTYHIAYGCLRR